MQHFQSEKYPHYYSINFNLTFLLIPPVKLFYVKHFCSAKEE